MQEQQSLPAEKKKTVLTDGPADDDDDDDDDWETTFSKRYPDLSGLEMVETVIDSGNGNGNGGSGSSSKEGIGRETGSRVR